MCNPGAESKQSDCAKCGPTEISSASSICSQSKIRAATIKMGRCDASCINQLLNRNSDIKVSSLSEVVI